MKVLRYGRDSQGSERKEEKRREEKAK